MRRVLSQDAQSPGQVHPVLDLRQAREEKVKINLAKDTAGFMCFTERLGGDPGNWKPHGKGHCKEGQETKQIGSPSPGVTNEEGFHMSISSVDTIQDSVLEHSHGEKPATLAIDETIM